MRKTIYSMVIALGISLMLSSCFKDLNLEPKYGVNAGTVYSDPDNYINVLAKLYAGLSMTGNNGPAGDADISGIDEGFSSYIRVLWNLQEVPTDDCVVGWNDPGLPELNTMTWVATNPWSGAMYYRIFFQITLCNEFIRETDPKKLQDRGFSQIDIDRITTYRYEARFLRALSYYHALDLFGSVPFVTENDPVGAFFPQQISRADLFNYIESELKDIEGHLIDPAPGFNPQYYARASKAAAWTLLAKLYLNAEVYTGSPRWSDCMTYCQKVIDQGGYSLQPNYEDLFKADNHTSPEIIFPVVYDGTKAQTWGGTTFLTHAPVGGNMNPSDFGINGGWAGYRATKGLVLAFTDTNDARYLFFTDGQNLEIDNISTFSDGYGVTKWKNVTTNGDPGSDPTGNFVDTDFPLFRLADVYLMYAEAAVKGGGDVSKGLQYINLIRQRANMPPMSSYNADSVLAERARELYWEGYRRTDLIRYGLYTGGAYLWPWKGGVKDGTSVPDFRNLYPLPESDIVANPNLQQNPGY